MPISETVQVLTKCALICRPRVLHMIRGLDAFVLGNLTFSLETRFLFLIMYAEISVMNTP